MRVQLTKIQRRLWALAGIATVGFLALVFWNDYWTGGYVSNTKLVAGSEVIQPQFRLTDHTGAAVTDATWRGKWLMVFFGYTNCPDVCPTTLAEMAAVMDGLGDDAAKVKPLFISVDPERDLVAELAKYVAAFHPAISGLTGKPSEIAATAKNFRAYYAKLEQPGAPDGYAMSHASMIYLVSPEGQFVRIYSFGTAAKDILEDLQPRL